MTHVRVNPVPVVEIQFPPRRVLGGQREITH
jgi:hypothetical protein